MRHCSTVGQFSRERPTFVVGKTLQHSRTIFQRERPTIVASKTQQYSRTDFSHIFQSWTLENDWLGKWI